MMRRWLSRLVILALMVGFGVGVNRYLGSRTRAAQIASAPASPVHAHPLFHLSGTMYMEQDGALYRLSNGFFSEIDSVGADLSWTQPALLADGTLVAVERHDRYSDLVHITPDGRVLATLTANAAPARQDINANHWAFYPRPGADGTSLFYSYDGPKDPVNGYRVDMAVWNRPLGGTPAASGRQWTTPNNYTGGDVGPVPLPGGGIVFTRYGIAADGSVYSTIWEQPTPGRGGRPLTAPGDDCSNPTLSPDNTRIAMICTAGQQRADLVIAPFSSTTGVGARTVVVQDRLCSSPTWSPDGASLAYVAPADATGHFQLWWIDRITTSTPAPPREVTSELDFDATSTMAWAPSGG